MFQFDNKRFFGIDIGESAIKLIEIKKTREGYRLIRGKLIELNIDPLFDDSEKQKSIIKESLKKLLIEEKIDSGDAALSIPGQSVFIRPLKVPKVAKSKIEHIIQYEAQLQVPFPINEVIWGYELFEIKDKPEVEVALVAVKDDIVRERINLLTGTGLGIDFVEVNPFALFNAVDFTNGIKGKIIIDIGAKFTDIIVVEEHKIWTRSVLMGGNDMTKAIAAALNISFKEAEELKRKEGVVALNEADRTSTPHAGAISDAINPVLVELLADVSKSIGYYKSQFGESKVFKEILITGGCSKLRNIDRHIAENIDMPTKTFNLLEKISSDLDFVPAEDLIGRMDVSVGLALRTVTPLFTRTNLLPKELLKAKEFEKKKWHIFGSLLLAVLIFATLTGFVKWCNAKKTTSLETTLAVVTEYTSLFREISGLQNEISDLRERLSFVKGLSGKRRSPLILFTELVRILPENIWLTEMEQDDEGILTIRGNAEGSFENINAFRDTLMESEYFKKVEIELADVLDETRDIQVFEIKIEPYDPESEPEGRKHGT